MFDSLIFFIEGFFIVLVLVCVAFITLLERKLLGYVQLRKGPNSVGYLGYFQPFGDGMKLFSSEVFVLTYGVGMLYLFVPIFGLCLFMMFCFVYPLFFGGLDFFWGLVYFFVLSSLGIYVLFGCGWSSNSIYSLLGSLRGVAQVISYEVGFIFVIISCCLISMSYDFEVIFFSQVYVMNVVIFFPLLVLWLISCFAETNRSPFDFSEGESELVSGFNIEYGSWGFSFIFMAEYGMIVLMSYFLVILFFGGYLLSFDIGIFFVLIWVLVRGCVPRLRYDKLMYMSWFSVLPVSLDYLVFGTGVLVIIMSS